MDVQSIVPKSNSRVSGQESSNRSHRASFKDKMERRKKEDEKDVAIDGPVQSSPLIAQVPNSNETKGTTPAEIIELSEKLAPPITDSSKKGLGKTHIILELKSLSSVEVVIDHYDTDPHTFYIKLMGEENAQRLFARHKSALVTQLRALLPTFNCSIATPTFRARSFDSKKERKNSLVKSPRVGYSENKDRGKTYE